MFKFQNEYFRYKSKWHCSDDCVPSSVLFTCIFWFETVCLLNKKKCNKKTFHLKKCEEKLINRQQQRTMCDMNFRTAAIFPNSDENNKWLLDESKTMKMIRDANFFFLEFEWFRPIVATDNFAFVCIYFKILIKTIFKAIYF